MPVQTTETSYVYFPDGCKVSLKASGEASYTDIGAINSAVSCTLQYDKNQVETANAGKLAARIKNMRIEGSFTLINLNPANVVRASGGLFTSVPTAASANSSIPDQVIAASWEDGVVYELNLLTSSSDSTKLKLSSAPTITSVTLNATAPETLTAGSDYVIVEKPESVSGYGIVFISGGMSTGTPTANTITIDYGINTPVARTTLYAGSSTASLTAYAMLITHTDSAGLKRELELYSVDTNAGGFVFSWKGANEEGVEEMPLSFTANLDTSLTDGRQLMAWSVDTGAA